MELRIIPVETLPRERLRQADKPPVSIDDHISRGQCFAAHCGTQTTGGYVLLRPHEWYEDFILR